jgi:3-oxosteroid 1-dehydrogenase
MAAEIGAAIHLIPMNMAMFLGFNIPNERPGEEPTYRSAGNKELSYPHTLVVNQDGERFADESYFQAILSALRHFDVWRHRHANLPCYLIFDQSYADKYSFAASPAGSPIPTWVSRANTLDELAAALGIDGARLAKTVARFNEFARDGEDRDFQRGRAPWSNYYAGDLTHQPNANLGPVERPPFYGIRLIPSGLSSAGLLTNGHGQVVHLRGHPMPGLYASGNAAVYVDYGAGYQAGLSLARGMTFSYLAVQHMLGEAAQARTGG